MSNPFLQSMRNVPSIAPLAQPQLAISNTTKEVLGGGEEPKPKSGTPSGMTPKEMEEWNTFIRFLKTKGVAGSKELDNRDRNMGQQFFDEFKKQNPNVSIGYDIVPRAQAEFLKFQKFHRNMKERKGVKEKDQFDRLSKEDGWLGSFTSQQELIPMVVETRDSTGKVVSVQNEGLMSGAGTPASKLGQNKLSFTSDGKPIAYGNKKVEQMGDGQWYVENNDGNLELVTVWNRRHGR